MNIRLLCCYKMIALLAAVTLLPQRAPADSLWQCQRPINLVADKKAQMVGDIVTILVQENSTASKNNTTTTTKDSKINAAITSFLYSPTASSLLAKKGTMPALQTEGKNDFTGGGTINNQEQIAASVAVQVIDVLPNQNLVIEGKRHTAFGGETQDIVLRGVVRVEDISANNTVYSYNVANATVTFANKGTVSNQKKGWFGKLWEYVDPF